MPAPETPPPRPSSTKRKKSSDAVVEAATEVKQLLHEGVARYTSLEGRLQLESWQRAITTTMSQELTQQYQTMQQEASKLGEVISDFIEGRTYNDLVASFGEERQGPTGPLR